MRAIAIPSGLAILAAATWLIVTDAGLDPRGPHALLLYAMAAGVAAGSVVMARTSWRVGLVVAVAVLAGESYGLLATAERVIRNREAVSADVRGGNTTREDATRRADAADAAIRAHDDAARKAIAEKGCAAECRRLLADTRADLVRDRANAVAAIPASMGGRSATPLADRLGIDPWRLDVAMAALLSLGANGLACVLIAFGAHAPARPEPIPVRADPVDCSDVPAIEAAESKEEIGRISPNSTLLTNTDSNVVAMQRRANQRDAKQFAIQCLAPAPGRTVPLREVIMAYWAWCDGCQLARPEVNTTIEQIGSLFVRANIETTTEAGGVVAHGVAVATTRAA